MKFAELSKNSLFVVLFSCTFAGNIFAQCSGIYFKQVSGESYNPLAIFGNYAGSPPTLLKDVTGDGKLDLIGRAFTSHELNVAPGEPNGNFGATINLPLPSGLQVTQVFAEDSNNDGLKDILVHNVNSPYSFIVYRNNGNGSFTPLAPQPSTSGTITNYVDINNDNRADIMLGNYYQLANADGTFAAPVMVGNSIYLGPLAGDFNGDGFKDFAQTFASYYLRVAYNTGNGNFTMSGDLGTIGSNGSLIAVTDFNNDGRPDILARNNSNIVVFPALASGGFNGREYPLNMQTPSVIEIGDYNGDGFQDIMAKSELVLSPIVANSVKPAAFFINNGMGIFSRTDYEAPVKATTVGDLDGDNRSDMLILNGGVDSVIPIAQSLLFLGEIHVGFVKNVCNKQGRTRTVDFDGDHVNDKAFFRPSDGRWRIKNSNNGSISSLNWGLNGDVPVPGDYAGDGKTDVAIYRPSNGTWWIINSANGAYSTVQFGISGDKPVPADYDGDGTTDIAVFRPSTGYWYIYYTGSGQFSVVHWGVSEDKPVPADYDGDGKADRAVFRPSFGTWYILKSSDFGITVMNWGISTDVPVPADYDGDGKDDVSVRRSSQNKWYIFRSFNSQMAIATYGLAGDIPQPSDWEGNGVFDLGVYRPGETVWYTSNKNVGEAFGESGEIPVSSTILQ